MDDSQSSRMRKAWQWMQRLFRRKPKSPEDPFSYVMAPKKPRTPHSSATAVEEPPED